MLEGGWEVVTGGRGGRGGGGGGGRAPPLFLSTSQPQNRLSSTFFFSPQWVELSTRTPEGLVPFFESATGKAYVRKVDEMMAFLRLASQQPDTNPTLSNYVTTREEFLSTLNTAEEIFLEEFLNRSSGTNTPTTSALGQVQESPLVLDALLSQKDERRTLMTERYEHPFPRGQQYPSTKPFEVTAESRYTFLGWDALKPGLVGADKVDGVPSTLLKRTSVPIADNMQSKMVYVVDGNNCFYSRSPVDWGNALRIDRHGEYGPVVVFCKEHLLRDKLQKWYEGPTHVYNALQELHGGAKLGYPVYIVSIDVRQCTRAAPALCLEYDTTRSRCQIRNRNGNAVVFPAPLCRGKSPWDHFLCEFDDVAANILFNYMSAEMKNTSDRTGYPRDVTFVTDERPKNYLKPQWQIDAISKAMETMSDGVRSKIWILHPNQVNA